MNIIFQLHITSKHPKRSNTVCKLYKTIDITRPFRHTVIISYNSIDHFHCRRRNRNKKLSNVKRLRFLRLPSCREGMDSRYTTDVEGNSLGTYHGDYFTYGAGPTKTSMIKNDWKAIVFLFFVRKWCFIDVLQREC